jgi:hypothetical protein
MRWSAGNGVSSCVLRTIVRRGPLCILIGMIGMIHAHDAERDELTILSIVNQTGTVGTTVATMSEAIFAACFWREVASVL